MQNDFQSRLASLNKISDEHLSHIQKLIDESRRVETLAHNASTILKNLENDFVAQTKLNGNDIAFLFFATALQCIRQYFLTNFKDRLGDQEAAKKTIGKDIFDPHNAKANNAHRLYKPTFEEIVSNSVPFDCQNYDGIDYNNPLSGYGKFGHRAATLGHDALLGWIFGTANISTSTLTTVKFQSFHIRNFKFANKANTVKVLSETFDKLMNQGFEGRKIVAFSVGKEAVHLMSDINSKRSLPIPVLSTITPEMANNLADFGLDMSNVLHIGKQGTATVAINMLIAMIHGLTFDENTEDKRLFEVRTHKIITYSNVIASTSNVIAVAIGNAIGLATENQELIKKSLRMADIGGLFNALYRLLTDRKFIWEIKKEFIYGNFDKMIQGNM